MKSIQRILILFIIICWCSFYLPSLLNISICTDENGNYDEELKLDIIRDKTGLKYQKSVTVDAGETLTLFVGPWYGPGQNDARNEISVNSSNGNIVSIQSYDEYNTWTLVAKGNGEATINIKWTKNSSTQESFSISITVGGIVGPEPTPTPIPPGEEDPIVAKYNAIDFEYYRDIYTNKKYVNMEPENLVILSDKIKEDIKIVDEYLEKYDQVVKDPIRPADSTKKEELEEYYRLEQEKEAGRKLAYDNRQLLKNLLLKVNDYINYHHYKAQVPEDIDKTLWEKAKDFLTPTADTVSGSKVASAVISIGSILITAATIIFPVIIIIMGIQYMLIDAEGKGKLKIQLFGVFISAGVTFGAFIIWRIAYAVIVATIK